MTTFRLAPSRVEDAPAPAPAPTPAQATSNKPTTAPQFKPSEFKGPAKIALTLPRDFNFASRGAERDEERKRRRAEREKAEEADRKQSLKRKADNGKSDPGKVRLF